MTTLYRSMIEDNDGHPEVGRSARKLGVRLLTDIEPDDLDMVDPGTGGMSVAQDSPEYLPPWRRPPPHGGDGDDPLWTIQDTDLLEGLAYRADEDREGHGFIEPASKMHLDQYEELLALTRDDWNIIP